MTKVQEKVEALLKNETFNIKNCYSVTEVLKKAGYESKTNGRLIKEAREFLISKGLDISHFTGNGSKPAKIIQKICPVCRKEFKLKWSLKAEKQVTCSYSCSNTFFRSGINNPNYKSGSNYRQVALNTLGKKCANCGYSADEDALEVHHIDKNRDNNNITNLIVLCSNCHSILHKILGR